MTHDATDATEEHIARDDELNDKQLAAMDSLWKARRAGHVTAEEEPAIERLIRTGHVSAARKRLTAARHRADGSDGSDGGSAQPQ